jgi:hypothetical protein
VFDFAVAIAMLLVAVFLVRRRRPLTLATFSILAMGFSYGIVPLVYQALGISDGMSEWVTFQYGVSLFLFIAGIWYLSILWPFAPLRNLFNEKSVGGRYVFMVISLYLGLEVFSVFYFHRFFTMSVDVDKQTGPGNQLVLGLMTFIMGAAWMVSAMEFARSFKWRHLAMTFVVIGLTFTEGRRVLVVFCWILVLAFIYIERPPTKKISFVKAGLIVLVPGICLLAFNATRQELNFQRDRSEQLSLVRALSNVQKGNVEDIFEGDKDNLQARELINIFHKRIINAQEDSGWMWGKALWAEWVYSVPRFLLPEKDDFLDSKTLIQVTYGLPSHDTPLTPMALGQADFGFLGALAYGFLFAFLLRCVEELAVRFGGTIIWYGAIGNAFLLASVGEEGLTSSLVCIRNTFGIAILYTIVKKLTKKKTP